MGLFKKQPQISPVETRLDMDWFRRWVNNIFEHTSVPTRSEEATFDYLCKASAVVDHDCRDYLERYTSAAVLKQYSEFYPLNVGTPWTILSFVAGCNSDSGWVDFIVNDAESKLQRFAEIVINPNVAGT